MKYKLTMTTLLCVGLFVTASAHDLFLKFDSYFLKPGTASTVRLLNGTFRKSENPVARDRMADVSLINPQGERAHPAAADWRDEGQSAVLNFQTGEAGTYVIGLYTKPREIALKAASFNDYLAHDGLPDILAARKKNGELNKAVREQYSKHVKALFQVGEHAHR